MNRMSLSENDGLSNAISIRYGSYSRWGGGTDNPAIWSDALMSAIEERKWVSHEPSRWGRRCFGSSITRKDTPAVCWRRSRFIFNNVWGCPGVRRCRRTREICDISLMLWICVRPRPPNWRGPKAKLWDRRRSKPSLLRIRGVMGP